MIKNIPYVITSIVTFITAFRVAVNSKESFSVIVKDLRNDKEEYVEDLSEFTLRTPEEIYADMYRGRILIRKEWDKKKPKTAEEVRKFYKETRNYLYDLGYWHFAGRRQFDLEMVTAAKGMKPKKILDFGAGIGQNAIMLAREGFDVTVADVESYTLDFAELRFERHSVPAKFWRIDKEPPPNEEFDMILCFDVLEHLPLDDMKTTVELLTSLKSEDCNVLLTTNFGKSNKQPMHTEQSEKSRELIERLLSKNKSSHLPGR